MTTSQPPWPHTNRHGPNLTPMASSQPPIHSATVVIPLFFQSLSPVSSQYCFDFFLSTFPLLRLFLGSLTQTWSLLSYVNATLKVTFPIGPFLNLSVEFGILYVGPNMSRWPAVPSPLPKVHSCATLFVADPALFFSSCRTLALNQEKKSVYSSKLTRGYFRRQSLFFFTRER